MTASATSQQPPAPAGDQGHAQQQGDQEAGRIQSIAELSGRQDRMEGKLDQLLARFGIGGQHQGAAPAGQPAPGPQHDPAARPAAIQDQMRQAIRDVHAEEAAAAAKTQGQQQPPAESAPREVTLRGKEKMQRRLFGCHT